MPAPAIEVHGLDNLRRGLRYLGDKGLVDELKEIHAEIAQDITDRAERKAPVRSGALRQSIRSSGTQRAAIGRVGKKSVVPYAAVIHWGWRKRGIPRRPFLQDAAKEIERDVVERYEFQINGLMGRVIEQGRLR